jgi:hypothetical protein
VVDVNADSVVRGQTDSLQVVVWSAAERSRLKLSGPTLSRTVPNGRDALEDSVWPLRLVLTPRDNDAERVFELTVTARGAGDKFVTQARVSTGYVEHKAHYVQVRLRASCVGVVCEEALTCNDGTCDEAWLNPKKLPLLPGRAKFPSEEAPDASSPMDSGKSTDAEMDASPEPDAAPERDAGPADAGPADAGPDRCLMDNGGCDPLVTCEWIAGSVACGACPNGFNDVNGDGTQCTDIDECRENNGGCDRVHGRCTNSPGAFECKCESGYHGDGVECSVNVPCGDDPSICDARATCGKMNDKRVCLCGAGFEGNGGLCSDIDECKATPAVCSNHSKCVNSDGSYKCECDPGYTLKDRTCVDVDECAAATDNCTDRPNACVNTSGSFMCKCPKGYTGPAVGSEGCNDTNECGEGMANCSRNASCMNTRGSFKCTCNSGFSGDGVTCNEIDECATNMDDCDQNATCTNTQSSFTCTCRTGYTGDGRTCTLTMTTMSQGMRMP